MEPADTCLPSGIYEAHAAYYERYKNLVYYRTRRRLSRYNNNLIRQEVDDLFQETFQSVFRWMRNYFEAHKAFPSEDVFARVLATIEVNEYRTYMKRLKYPPYKTASRGGSHGDAEDSTRAS